MIDVAALHGQTTFVTGSSRGSGKTTFLNYLAGRLRPHGPLCLASIGAEEAGAAGLPQGARMGPRIFVDSGDLVVTAYKALAGSAGLFRIIDEMGTATSFGRIVCAEVLRGTSLAMIGPMTHKQLADLLGRCQADQGERTLLIDGSFNRLTQVAALLDCGFIEVIKVDGAAAKRRLEFLSLTERLAVWDDGQGAAHHVDGALTSDRLAGISSDKRAIVVEDFTKIFLEPSAMARLPLMVRRRIPLKGVVVHPYGISRACLQSMMAASGLGEKIVVSPFFVP